MRNAPPLLPEGFRDRLPPFAEAASRLERDVLDSLARHGYARVSPPLVEYEATLSAPISRDDMAGGHASGSRNLLRFVDPISQQTLAMRSDMTRQIGRIAMTSMRTAARPLRLSYSGPVLRLRAGQLHPERGRLQIGAELIGNDSVAAACELIMVAVEALENAGVQKITVDFTLPDLIDLLSSGPLPLTEDQVDAVRAELDMKDAGALAALGAASYLPLIEATGPYDQAMAKMRAFDSDGLLTSRLDGLDEIAAALKNRVGLTLDPTERHGFAYQSWFGFTIYAEDFIGALGRGGSYTLDHGAAGQPAGDGKMDKGAQHGSATGTAEPAMGFSLYPDPLIDAGFGAKAKNCLFLPLDHDRQQAAECRKEGWRTVAALSQADDAQTLGCTHILSADGPQSL